MPKQINRTIVFGDSYGAPELIARIPDESIVGIVAAANRPQYHDFLFTVAKEKGVPLIVQPAYKDEAVYSKFLYAVKKLHPDSLMSHSYSMIVRNDVLNVVDGNAFNVHQSLLPLNRGPNPVQWSLIHGDEKTGVSVHIMNECFDSGPILDQEEVRILQTDTWVTLSERLKSASCKLLDRTIPALLEGKWKGKKQAGDLSRVNTRITPESYPIDFSSMSDVEIFNLIRAQVSPLAGAYLDAPMGRINFRNYLTVDDIADLRRKHA